MMDSRELFSANILTDDEIINAAIKALNVDKKEILIIRNPDGWINKKEESIIFESMGLLDEGDTEEYIGCYYYNIYFKSNEFLDKIKLLEKEFDTKVKVNI